MHAVVVTVTIEPGHADEAVAQLETNVVPAVKQAPGVVSGYWLVPSEGHGLSLVLFETEEAARAAAEAVPNRPMPDFVTFDKVEVREVVAHF